jgi:parallel beta-helix repeat protein
MENMKRILAIGIILLFIGMSLSSSTGYNAVEQSITPLNGKTLYVGGSGPGNYTKIQDAIDNASDGDTVFVYNGTYVEHLIVDKSINLLGENKKMVVIQSYFPGEHEWSIIQVKDNNVSFCNFTIKYDNFTEWCWKIYGVKITSNNNHLFNNIISGKLDYGMRLTDSYSNKIVNNTVIINGIAIKLDNSNNNNFTNNILYNCSTGFYLLYASNNIISKNKICVWQKGIYTYKSKRNIITNNTFSNNKGGIYLHYYSNSTLISSNIFKRNFIGVTIHGSNLNDICFNNFILNIIPARFISRSKNDTQNNWSKNYWQRPREKPKIIPGSFWIVFYNLPGILRPIVLRIPRFNVDYYPAQEPYDIEV